MSCIEKYKHSKRIIKFAKDLNCPLEELIFLFQHKGIQGPSTCVEIICDIRTMGPLQSRTNITTRIKTFIACRKKWVSKQYTPGRATRVFHLTLAIFTGKYNTTLK